MVTRSTALVIQHGQMKMWSGLSPTRIRQLSASIHHEVRAAGQQATFTINDVKATLQRWDHQLLARSSVEIRFWLDRKQPAKELFSASHPIRVIAYTGLDPVIDGIREPSIWLNRPAQQLLIGGATLSHPPLLLTKDGAAPLGDFLREAASDRFVLGCTFLF